jgi:hypothetical protein
MNRWQRSLHEAGRVVAAHVLSNHKAVAKVYHDAGACWPSRALTPMDREVVLAIGPLAAALAERDREPELPPHLKNKPIELQAVGQVDSLDHPFCDFRAASDLALIADYRIDSLDDPPQRWSQRGEWAGSIAERLISQHHELIVKAARELFLHGVVSIPLPERKES